MADGLSMVLFILSVVLAAVILAAALLYLAYRALKEYFRKIVMAEHSVIEQAREQERQRMEQLMVQHSMANMAAVAEGAARGAGNEAVRGVISGAHLCVDLYQQQDDRRAVTCNHRTVVHRLPANGYRPLQLEQSHPAGARGAPALPPPRRKRRWLTFWKRT